MDQIQSFASLVFTTKRKRANSPNRSTELGS